MDPAGSDDGRADQAMPIVQVGRRRDVLTAMAAQVSGELRSRCRAVDPTRKVQLCVGHSVPVANDPSSAGKRPDEVKGCRDHRGALQ